MHWEREMRGGGVAEVEDGEKEGAVHLARETREGGEGVETANGEERGAVRLAREKTGGGDIPEVEGGERGAGGGLEQEKSEGGVALGTGVILTRVLESKEGWGGADWRSDDPREGDQGWKPALPIR